MNGSLLVMNFADLATARAFAERLCPETAGLKVAVTEGADAVLNDNTDLFAS